MPVPRGEKRTKPVTVHVPPSLKVALEKLSKHEERTLSTLVCRIVERDPLVQTLLQKIEGTRGN